MINTIGLVILNVIILILTLALIFWIVGRTEGKLKTAMSFIAISLIPQVAIKILVILNTLREIDLATTKFIIVFLDFIFVLFIFLAVLEMLEMLKTINGKYKRR